MATKKIKTGVQFRAAEIIERNDEDRTVSLAFSSEEPVERSFGMEILDHSSGAIDLDFIGSGRAPLLVDHDTSDPVGVVENVNLDDVSRVARASVRFGKSARASEIFTDVSDGIRTNVSVGYRINQMERTGDDEGRDVFTVSDWSPMEISIVSVPADTTVGVGRSDEFETRVIEEETDMTEEVRAVETVEPKVAEAPRVDMEALTRKAREAESTRVAEIMALGAAKNMRDKAVQSIQDGLSVEQFRGVVIDALPVAQPLEVGEPDISPKEERQFSFLRAINASATGDWRSAGYEREVSDEIAKLSGREAKGFYAPGSAWGQRNIIAGTNADGGFLKGTDHLGGEFIEALRGRLVVAGLGARMMSGLKGDISIPKISAGAAAAFVGEGSAVAEQNQTFAAVTLAPKTLGAFTDISRKLSAQSSPDAEAIVRDDLLNAVAAKLEDVTIEGDGSNEPTGITKTSGIGSVAMGTNGAAPNWASVVNLVKECEVDNALMTDNLAFLTNPKVKAKLSSTAKGSGDSVMIMESPWDSLYGYPVGITTHVPGDLTKGSTSGSCSAMIFGDFSQLIMGFWGSADILVDPYTGGSAGNTRVIVMQDVDVAVRHAQSFAACLDYTTT